MQKKFSKKFEQLLDFVKFTEEFRDVTMLVPGLEKRLKLAPSIVTKWRW